MINKLLSTAFQLYLRSQVTQAEDLQVTILGKNRQILQGYVPQLVLNCTRAVYQGLFLQRVEVKGTDIGFNLPEVLNRKPLQLLEPIVVEVKFSLSNDDLKASLPSLLLQSALNDLWQMILDIESEDHKLTNSTITWQEIAIADQCLDLIGIYPDITGKIRQLRLFTKLSLINPHTLHLYPVEITDISIGLQELKQPLTVNLGTDVVIEQLVFAPQQILCVGKIIIKPISS